MSHVPADDLIEYILRVWKLMEEPRRMSLNAAKIVIDAAMFGKGCIDKKFADQQAAQVLKG